MTRTTKDGGLAPCRCSRCGCSVSERDVLSVCRDCVSRWDRDHGQLLHEFDHVKAALRSRDEDVDSLRERVALKGLQAEAIAEKLEDALKAHETMRDKVMALNEALVSKSLEVDRLKKEDHEIDHLNRVLLEKDKELDRLRKAVTERDLITLQENLSAQPDRELEFHAADLQAQLEKTEDELVLVKNDLVIAESDLREKTRLAEKHHEDRERLQRDRDWTGEQLGQTKEKLDQFKKDKVVLLREVEKLKDSLKESQRELAWTRGKLKETRESEDVAAAEELSLVRKVFEDHFQDDSNFAVRVRGDALPHELVEVAVTAWKAASESARQAEDERDRLQEQLDRDGSPVAQALTERDLVKSELVETYERLEKAEAELVKKDASEQTAIHALTRIVLWDRSVSGALVQCNCEQCRRVLFRLRELNYLPSVPEEKDPLEDRGPDVGPEVLARHLSRLPKPKDLMVLQPRVRRDRRTPSVDTDKMVPAGKASVIGPDEDS